MFIVSPTVVLTLFNDRSANFYIYLTTFRLDTLKIFFKRIFMDFTSFGPPFKFCRGVFVNKDTYFVGSNGQKFYTTPGYTTFPDVTYP